MRQARNETEPKNQMLADRIHFMLKSMLKLNSVDPLSVFILAPLLKIICLGVGTSCRSRQESA